MSVLAYGWVFRVPSGTVMDKCARQMMGKSLREGGWHLKNVIEGGVVHTLVVLTTRLFNLSFGAWQDKDSMEAFAWTDVPQHSVSLLRMLMAKLGWIEQGPFNWTHSELEEGIAVNKVAESTKVLTKEKIKYFKQTDAHATLESFRFGHWNKFWATSKRHDAEELRSKGVDTKYPAARLQKARKMASDGVAMAVMTGAFKSPGHFRP